MDDGSLVELASRLDVVTLLIFIGVAGARAMWVFGWVYRNQVEQTEYWRSVAERLLNIAETTTDALPPIVQAKKTTRFGSGADD